MNINYFLTNELQQKFKLTSSLKGQHVGVEIVQLNVVLHSGRILRGFIVLARVHELLVLGYLQ